jgi:hypothetical protein
MRASAETDATSTSRKSYSHCHFTQKREAIPHSLSRRTAVSGVMARLARNIAVKSLASDAQSREAKLIERPQRGKTYSRGSPPGSSNKVLYDIGVF